MKENNHNDSTDSALKIWLEDNLRVLLSILIVIAIAGGIYSYSKRSQQAPTVTDITQESQDSLLDKVTPEKTTDSSEVKKEAEAKDSDVSKKEIVTPKDKPEAPVVTETSKESEDSFTESANKGDGVTHLARRATANYLEKNPDSSLTVEHKIYIEDYLRKNVSKKDKVVVGTSIEFSKDLIHTAIEKSKQLNDKQLNNLKKYSARTPSLK